MLFREYLSEYPLVVVLGIGDHFWDLVGVDDRTRRKLFTPQTGRRSQEVGWRIIAKRTLSRLLREKGLSQWYFAPSKIFFPHDRDSDIDAEDPLANFKPDDAPQEAGAVTEMLLTEMLDCCKKIEALIPLVQPLLQSTFQFHASWIRSLVGQVDLLVVQIPTLDEQREWLFRDALRESV